MGIPALGARPAARWPVACAGVLLGLAVGFIARPLADVPAPTAPRALAAPTRLRDSAASRLPICAETVRVLSLDGGGMRGLIGATVLEELELILSDKLGAPARLGDFFDVVVGTSTGGLQAAALMVGHGAANLSDIYTRHGPTIFSNETRNCKPHQQAIINERCTLDLYNLGGLIYDCLPALAHCYLSYPTYSTDGIERVAREYLGELTTAEEFGGRVLGMTTYDLLRGTPITLTNLGASAASTYSLVDAALATSAAPTFFNPRNLTCVGCAGGAERVLAADGALYANNPTLIAYELAEKMAAERLGCALTPDRSLVLSLGTGRQRSDLYRTGNLDLRDNTLGSVLKTVVQFLEYNDTRWWDEQWGSLKWIFLPLTAHQLELLNAALIGQEELTDQFFKKVFGASGAATRYLRVNVDLSRFERAAPFDASPHNVAALRGIGEEAAMTARYRLSRFADELMLASARDAPSGRLRGEAGARSSARARWSPDSPRAVAALGLAVALLAIGAAVTRSRYRARLGAGLSGARAQSVLL
ncbi:hypothetical protein KFE25_002000 [Diacronema lutheri]|uniref:PNPLA domain-containing protein n=1 Tax=Diacronema lutheri TaxID=2081491 RepID=A0A8J5XMN3_DIALT|nr:hypothetical protein KFE25_002000 [Diacronema lutheri]